VIALAVQHFLLFYAGVFALIALTASVGAGLAAADRVVMSPGGRIAAQAGPGMRVGSASGSGRCVLLVRGPACWRLDRRRLRVSWGDAERGAEHALRSAGVLPGSGYRVPARSR